MVTARASEVTEATETLKRYFEHLFANSRDIMNLFSLTQGKIIMLNRAAEEATGYTAEELSRVSIDAIYPSEEHSKLALAFERLRRTGYSSDKLRMYTRNGEQCDIWTRSYVIQHEPEVVCLVHTIDVTEENRKRERELRNAKLATLGESSATLAHELKNALQSMQFSLGALRNQICKSEIERAEVTLARIERAVAHMDDVIAGVENSARNAHTGASDVSLPGAIQNTLQLLHGYLDAKGIEVTAQFDSSLPLVWCDRTQLEQILIVLIKNAAQAMASRPTRQLRISVAKLDGRVRAELEDSGGGIPPEIEARLFTAFVTTKPAGLGTGLGLATAKQLALKNGIELTFDSRAGHGTTFALECPIRLEVPLSAEAPLGGRVVLVVGDEPAMLEAVGGALREAAARVLVATSAAEGIQLLRVHTMEVVICDDAMYPVGGQAFVREARCIYTGPVCLVVNDAVGLVRRPGVDAVLEKPLSPEKLVATLRALVA